MSPRPASRRLFALTFGAALSLSLASSPSQAHGDPSAVSASTLSALPVALSVTATVAPSALLVAGGTLVVVSVTAVAGGTVWVLERASDGARISLRVTGRALAASATLAGTAVVASAVGAGTVLSVAGQAIAFVPNEVGKALLHHEKVSR